MNTRHVKPDFVVMDNPEYLKKEDILRIIAKSEEEVSKIKFLECLSQQVQVLYIFLGG